MSTTVVSGTEMAKYTYHRSEILPSVSLGSHLKMEYDPEPWRKVLSLLVEGCGSVSAPSG